MGSTAVARLSSPTGRVLLISGLLYLTWAVLPLVGTGGQLPAPGVAVPWWLVAVMLAAAELMVFHVRVGREEQSVSISELPLVIGLFALAPSSLMLARMLGSGSVFLLHHRTTALKSVLNIALLGSATATAIVVFHLVAGPASALEPRGWLAAVAACAAAGLLESIVLLAVIAGWDGWPPLATVRRELLGGVVLPAQAAVAGVIASLALSLGPAAVLPLVMAFAVVIAAYRQHAGLRDRHAALERLFALSEDLSASTSVADIAGVTTRRAIGLLRGRSAELVLTEPGRAALSWRAVPVGQDGDGPAPAPVSRPLEAGEPAALEPLLGAARVRHHRVSSAPAAVALLMRERGIGELIVVPLSLPDGARAVLLVAQRPGQARWYRRHDLRLAETLANQVSLALRHARAVQQLEHEVLHDGLTGLPNRTAFRRAADLALARAGGQQTVAVGVVDLDGFKALNDSLGHLAGDQVIAEVGHRMASLAGPRTSLYRLGGDEFVVLAEQVGSEADALAVGSRVLAEVSATMLVDGAPVAVSASVGMALAPRDAAGGDHLLRCADLAMYAAKRASSGVLLFGRDVVHPIDDPGVLAADLRQALARGEVTVAVQPVLDLREGRVHSAEVLARWRHPALGSVEPTSFVAVAERNGLSVPLAAVVLDAALRACRDWQAAGLHVPVTVNLSARALEDAGLPDRVHRALAEHGVPGELLMVEVNEAGAVQHPERARRVLEGLRDLGVGVCLDDFGAGSSSMTYVGWLGPDQVKIDKGLVQGLDRYGQQAAMVRSIVDLGHHLGAEVVAEGVGDAVTAAAVAELGCGLVQGFLYAEPMPAEALPAWSQLWARTERRGPVAERASRSRRLPEDAEGPDRLRLVR